MLKAVVPIVMMLLIFGHTENVARPKFQDFEVRDIYKGVPADPRIPKEWRRFRTMIRIGANSKVAFAGHYTVPSWGCGSACSMFVIVDSNTGRVYDGFSITDLSMEWMDKHPDSLRIEFHARSRLLKVDGCPDERNCGFYDYVMVEGKGLKLLRKELLPDRFR